MNRKKIHIKNFGPITEFDIELNDFNILTGPQASGKSTVAKVVFFCLTLKNEIVNQLVFPKNEDVYDIPVKNGVEKTLRGKFLKTFGSTWAMPMDMEIVCEYNDTVSMRIFLEKDYKNESRNIVKFELSRIVWDFVQKLEDKSYPENEKLINIRREINEFFSDNSECIYVPAGRGMITLLTDQLSYIFSSVSDITPSTIDYCTRSYVERILRLRPELHNGLEGLLEEKLRYTQERVDKNSAEIMLKLTSKVLKGKYCYISGEERLEINNDRFVKINYASSGQQESAWIFNLMFYYMLNKREVFLILEEPEAHLYPESQYYITKALGLFMNKGNNVMITTHSPYILGTINTMLYASKLPNEKLSKQSIMDKDSTVSSNRTIAYYLNSGKTCNAIEEGLIINELIDDAAEKINAEIEALMNLLWDDRE